MKNTLHEKYGEINQSAAFDKVVKAIANDYELYHSYRANIAVAFMDECHRYKKSVGKKYLTNMDLYIISNNSAHEFLQLLINR
jgi:hypothetical protein